MSDDLRAGGTTERNTGVVDHRCEHAGCAAWGSFGYARTKIEPTRWYCYGHRDDGELLLGR